ncbi:unnamed protein product [Merluccius merluccius]
MPTRLQQDIPVRWNSTRFFTSLDHQKLAKEALIREVEIMERKRKAASEVSAEEPPRKSPRRGGVSLSCAAANSSFVSLYDEILEGSVVESRPVSTSVAVTQVEAYLAEQTIPRSQPFVLAKPLDLSAEDFFQCLRDNVPGVPAEFELSSTWEVVPLTGQCPLDIRNRRELNRLLMMAIQGTLGVFEGRSNELFFSYDLRALEQQEYFKAGKLTAWSVAHGGPGPRSISRAVYLLMCGQSAPLSDLDIGVLLDEEKGGKLQQEMPQVIERVVANYCFHRSLPIFCSTGGKLTRQTFRGLFLMDWRPEGSNDREEEEEETIFQYDDWLIKVEEGEVDAVFVTGADHPPALGFPRKCEVHFFNQEPGTRRLPYASTCALFLYLPRGVREEEDFADMMSTARRVPGVWEGLT